MDKFGINMKHYCREHEASLNSQPATRALLEEHLQMIQRLQHERLIHLIRFLLSNHTIPFITNATTQPTAAPITTCRRV